MNDELMIVVIVMVVVAVEGEGVMGEVVAVGGVAVGVVKRL